jgi:hypothetical protein
MSDMPMARAAQHLEHPASAKAADMLPLSTCGEVQALDSARFRDRSKFDRVAVDRECAPAEAARWAKALAAVDQAPMRYSIIHLRWLLDPGAGAINV